MAEVEIPENYPHREGHIPDMETVFLDLYRLLSIFFASEKFAHLRNEHGGDPISGLQEPEEDEITRILINTAVVARIIDDRDEHFLSQRNTECGVFVEDLEQPIEKELTLREACNKIIHATKIRTDLEKKDRKHFLTPTMYFYGSFRDKNWKATIDIVRFAEKYYENFKHA